MANPSLWSRAYGLLVAAVAGAVVLGLEVLAARTLAPALGNGPIVWAVLLAVALGALASGNLSGGFLAGRCSREKLLTWALVIASAALMLLSQVHTPVVSWAAHFELAWAALAAALLTQCVPLLMLGLLTPVLLRIDDDPADTTRQRFDLWSGAVLAAGSGGGIVGALAVGLWLLPDYGLCYSYLILAVLPALAALPSALRGRHWRALLLLAVVLAACLILWWRSTRTDSAGGGSRVLQSRQGQVEIRETDGQRILLLDGLPQTGMPGEIAPGDAFRHGYLLELAVGLGRPRNALVIGLGGGIAPRVLATHGIECEAVELDERVADLARSEFGCVCPVTVADGRAFLARTERKWDLIFLDVCTSERLAWHLFTVEGLQLVRERLNPHGTVALQFIAEDGSWPASVAKTVEAVFRTSAMLEAPNPLLPIGPKWIIACASSSSGLSDSLKERDAPWTVLPWPQNGALLTDDRFPAEWAWARTAQRWRSVFGAR